LCEKDTRGARSSAQTNLVNSKVECTWMYRGNLSTVGVSNLST